MPLFANNTASTIGLTELVFHDSSRVFESQPRPLEVAIWYPTEQNTQTQKVEFGIWKIKDAAKNAPIVQGKKQITHMTLLNEGTEEGIRTKPAYTLDHSSVDRGETHRNVAAQALEFFNAHLL